MAAEELLATEAQEMAQELDDRAGGSCAIAELLATAFAELESVAGEDELFAVSSLDVSEVGTACEESLDCFVDEVSVGVDCFESFDMLCSIEEDDSSLI